MLVVLTVYHEEEGYVGYPNRGSIQFYAIFYQENIEQDSLNNFSPLLISNSKF